MGFLSEKGGNYVTSGWFRDWTKVVVVVAGRGRERKGEPAKTWRIGGTHTHSLCAE